MLSLPQLPTKNNNHELNNQGCLCEFCQKINMTQNMVQSIFFYSDRQSEQYHPYHHKENYLDMIDQLMEWDKLSRKLRFCLPEICVFFGGTPVHLLTKSKENSPIKLIRSKSRLNVFQLQHFFLDGYLQHMPEISNRKREKHEFKEKMRQVLTIAAKYSKNVIALYTLDQLGNMFKSKFKYMRENLMYLQTLVGGHHSAEYLLKIDISSFEGEHPDLYERAKVEASIFVGITKVTDAEFFSEKEEIDFEDSLRKKDRKLYLTYLSVKMILISSKFKNKIMKQTIFKWTCVKGNDFLWDLRIVEEDQSTSYWESSGTQALEIKLQKTMSMLQFGTDSQLVNKDHLGPKTSEMQKWLEKSTQTEWNQMKIIRSRLQKLQNQKKALMESQKQGLSGQLNNSSKLYRMRNLKKREFLNQSVNPQI